jgi:hypothetical protein
MNHIPGDYMFDERVSGITLNDIHVRNTEENEERLSELFVKAAQMVAPPRSTVSIQEIEC